MNDQQSYYFILKDKKPIPVEFKEWSHWFEASLDKEKNEKNKSHERWIAETLLDEGKVRVSTIFLSLNHNFFQQGSPILFETMIFGLNNNDEYEYQTRCTTYEEALEMHEKAVEFAKGILDNMRYVQR